MSYAPEKLSMERVEEPAFTPEDRIGALELQNLTVGDNRALLLHHLEAVRALGSARPGAGLGAARGGGEGRGVGSGSRARHRRSPRERQLVTSIPRSPVAARSRAALRVPVGRRPAD